MGSSHRFAHPVFLSDGDFGEETLHKIQRGVTLVFKLAPNLHGIRVKLFINHTKNKFDRKMYHELGFSDNEYDEETSAKLDIEKPGTFHFYFIVVGRDSNPSGGGYFLVDPDLRIKNNESLSLDSISMITYMAKCLGLFKDWEGRLNVAKETGFNFIHFTPVQSLGSSGSGYSILDQLQLNPSFGKVSWDEMKLFINRMRTEWGVLSLCDIVLNHTANETPWLKSHPESAYNLVNCPHLVPAYLLDRLLVQIGNEIAEDKWKDRGVSAFINSEDHLNNLRVLLRERVTELRIEEFYLANVEDCKIDLPFEGTSEIIHTYKRYGSKVAGSTPRWKVEELNELTRNLIRSHLEAAVENVIAGVRYERVENSGPKYDKVDKERPLIHRYFEEVKGYPESVSAEEIALNPSTAQFIMAHNGWVMNDDPLRNFADADSNVYLRRELIAWGDSIKLRYGDSPESSPFLWSLMREYTELVASVFHGLRLDNCHSTPLRVAEFLIDAARSVRPELLVVAELFTNSDLKDNVFVNRLGINVLIREAQQAWSSHEEGRLLFRYGGKPVGAFENTAPPAIANALLFDQTHDNPSPAEKRSVKDILPTAALVSFGACAVGSNRGYDDIVPHHIHVVNEFRFYTSFTEKPPSKGEVGFSNGMFLARKSLNKLHHLLGQEGFSETFVDQLDGDVVCITRSNPISRKSMILVAYTAFSLPPDHFKRPPYSVRAVEVEGEVTEVLFEGRLIRSNSKYERDEEFLTGLDCSLQWKEGFGPDKSKMVEVKKGGHLNRIEFVDFQPGDVIALAVSPFKSTSIALQNINQILKSDQILSVVAKLDLVSLNHVLYRCKEEEGGIYALPNFGDLVYAGFQGIASILDKVSINNDLGHPICSNLRGGNWLMEYIASRLLSREATKEFGLHVQQLFQNVGELPRYLVPTYFDQVFKRLYTICVEEAWDKMNVGSKSEFVKLLALTSLQFVGIANGGALPAGGSHSDFMEDGKPFISYSLSAGLPHFSTGYMRSWGRDTFIALPGLLLLTNRFEESKEHILSYASVMKNGLIPNLLNKGNCRYNCRDATWWWLYSIVKYIELVPNGLDILQEEVRFENKVTKLQDMMHLTIQKHFEGIHFREENAGQRIDAHMKDEGFNIDIDVDIQTGLIHGGNAYNCGTWMDKMGSSDAGGNRGIPATPRDGASVEIIGLSAAVLKTLGEIPEYQYKFVERAGGVRLSYTEWYNTIKSNFESLFFISSSSVDSLVNCRNIYKDTVGASNKFGDYQLRPNFLIAMVVAPELFNKEHALLSLNTVQEKLLSTLGIKTLDESDWNYNGDYFNADGSDYKTAGGFNYHQGPEWLWPVGYYLRARLIFSSVDGIPGVRQVLSRHYEYLQANAWRSLPELTNRGGKVCTGSCTAQAWSCGTLLEVLNDLDKLIQ